ncbi:MAG: hypothetical protein KKD18_06065 [Nanoarchaeota archaeon]|nr:hypothetical protein [Nanoarchaeota archaeon]
MPSGSVNFTFLFEGSGVLSYCDLYLDDHLKESFSEPQFGVLNSLEVRNVSVGRHHWKVVCFADMLTEQASDEGFVVLFRAGKYGGRTTDLNLVDDLSRVEGFTLEDSFGGLILFNEPLDLSEGIDFDEFVKIEHNRIEVDSEAVPELNASANLTFYGLEFENPVILRDGVFCGDCEGVNGSKGLTFKVNHFSSYTVSENSALRLFDTTDDSEKYVSQSVTFYANYTNVSDGSSITGFAFCNVTFPDSSEVNMLYNAGSGMYEYSRSFGDAGTYLFDVKCYGAEDGFTNLEDNDTYTILPAGAGGKVNGANVTAL